MKMTQSSFARQVTRQLSRIRLSCFVRLAIDQVGGWLVPGWTPNAHPNQPFHFFHLDFSSLQPLSQPHHQTFFPPHTLSSIHSADYLCLVSAIHEL